MLGKKIVPVWFGIILLCGMFLMGQDTWVPSLECSDLDGDGFGFIPSSLCPQPYEDCCDQEADVYPGAPELCDGRDNQCLGSPGFNEVDEGCDPANPEGMAMIPSGCFDMGDALNELNGNALPVHRVCLSAYEIDYHEVTNRDYAACVRAGGCASRDTPWEVGSLNRWSYFLNHCYDDFPVIQIKWVHARNYCDWAGKRLPTEAEWEYAARGGMDGKRYPWGDTISGADANYANSGDQWDEETSPVTYYSPNGYGLYGMTGNVEEWVNDRDYFLPSSNYYAESPTNDPQGPETGSYRIIRGGSFISDPHESSPNDLALAFRHSGPEFDPSILGLYWVGFRCARSGDCVDEDHDGYGDPDSSDCIYSGLDCDDTASWINPGAMEICDSGTDEDCDTLVDGNDPDCQ